MAETNQQYKLKYVFDLDGVKHFECVFKHLCALHGLGWEWVTTITAPQLSENEGESGDILRKTLVVSSVTSEIEEVIDEFLKEFMLREAEDAAEQIRVSEADLRQFVWQYGHYVLAEEHIADYISLYQKKLQNAGSDEEKKRCQAKILRLSKFLHVIRLERKKCFTEFVAKLNGGDEGK